MKDKLLNIRVNDEVITKLNAVSERLGIPYSQIVRQAIDEKLESLEKIYPQLKDQPEAAAEKVAA
jgi:predicted DNA-binding protein